MFDKIYTTFSHGAKNNRWGANRRVFEVLKGTYRGMCTLHGIAKKQGEDLRRSDRHVCMTNWAKEMLQVLNVQVVAKGIDANPPAALYMGNHISYLDIPLMMAIHPVVFVAKKELASWPIFGAAMRGVGTVFVERESRDSRKGAADAIAPTILKEKQSVVIFPSGTTTLNEAKPWRWGAFVIAKRYNIPVVPFRIRYQPARTAAFIDEDYFLSHLRGVAKCSGGIQATVEFHPTIQIQDPETEARKWWEWSKI